MSFMAGLGPATHEKPGCLGVARGCPAQGRARTSQAQGRLVLAAVSVTPRSALTNRSGRSDAAANETAVTVVEALQIGVVGGSPESVRMLLISEKSLNG